MKIYYTTSMVREGDYSFYGIFAEDGGQFFKYSEIGGWDLVTDEDQINYYKTCQKVDLEEYMAQKDQPETLKVFQRTKSRKIDSSSRVYFPELDGSRGYARPATDDTSYLKDPAVVLCQLPDGNYLIYDKREKGFEKLMNRKYGRVKVLSGIYLKDGNYTITETDTQAVPKDIFEDEVVSTLDEKLNPENVNF